jgi:hypothetical protein
MGSGVMGSALFTSHLAGSGSVDAVDTVDPVDPVDSVDAGRGVLALTAVRFFLAGLATGAPSPHSAASSSMVSSRTIPATRLAKPLFPTMRHVSTPG